jgi:hypothetical protein
MYWHHLPRSIARNVRWMFEFARGPVDHARMEVKSVPVSNTVSKVPYYLGFRYVSEIAICTERIPDHQQRSQTRRRDVKKSSIHF